MRFLLLSPESGMLVLNLVAASLLISLVALAAARLVRQNDPLRHAILCMALFMMALSPLPIAAMNYIGIGIVPFAQAQHRPVNVVEVASRTSTPSYTEPRQESGIADEVHASMMPISSNQLPNALPVRESVSQSRPQAVKDADTNIATRDINPEVTMGWLSLNVSLFAIVWLVGLCVLSARLVLSFQILRQLRHSIIISTNPRLMNAATRIQNEWKISTSVVESNLAPAPLTMGFLQPVIVVPGGLVAQLNEVELDCVLSHEAAHVVRNDTIMALVQQLAATAFWWNPLLHSINATINDLRERICDAHVVHRRGEGLSLARALVLVAEWSSNRWSQLPLVAPLLADGGLAHRISILTSYEPLAANRTNCWSRTMLTSFVMVLCGISLLPLMRYEAVSSSNVLHSLEQSPQGVSVAPTNVDPETTPKLSQESENVGTSKSDQKTLVWREGTTVSGRVIDHRGIAVEKAEVLLLGPERIIVDADRKTWFVPDRNSIKPVSTRTDFKGEFKITREHGEADRIAVITENPIFWVISRSSLPQDNNVELKLPAAGKLAVQCDLPKKPSDIPVMIELATFDGVNWHKDSLRLHMSTTSLTNPGQKTFEHLPPGHYSVQFYSQMRTGNSILQSGMDRQLVEVTEGNQSTIGFDRKKGQPITGQVIGMEDAKLKYALLTVSNWGPEEEMNKNGRRVRRLVGFDVISIDSDGHFTTDPMPPGKYEASLFAILASTPDLSTQSADFAAHASFTVPEQGDLPIVEIVAKASASNDLSKVDDLRVRAIDEEGKPIAKLQAMIHTADAGYGHWTNGSDGIVFLGGQFQYRSEVLDVFVRADGFASSFARFEGKQKRDKLSNGEATITLRRGTPVQLQFNLPSGLVWPGGTLPETYFDNMQDRVRIMRQSVNRRSEKVPDFNFLNLRDIGSGRFEFQLAEQTPPFHAAIHAPGFLQYFEAGSFNSSDVKNNRIEIEVPPPATVEITFEPGEHARVNSPFKSATVSLMRHLEASSYLTVADSTNNTLEPKLNLTDLAPGNYMVQVRTQPKDENQLVPNTQINLGSYFDQKEVELSAGQNERINFRSEPYQPDVFRGSRTAILRIKTPDGKPATDCKVQVRYFDGHYGSQTVFDGKVPTSGEVVLSGITDKVPTTSTPNRAYSVVCDGEYLGSFFFNDQDTTENFEFYLIPGAGDLAPDVKLTNLTSGEEIDLNSFRGKVVLLEFWATWCGPCQAPMEKLNDLIARRKIDWKDRAVIIPVSIEGDREQILSHIQSRGWTSLDHFMTGTSDQKDFDALAARKFVVSGVPEAVLIGPDGRILWRGHPLEQFSGKNLEAMINDAAR